MAGKGEVAWGVLAVNGRSGSGPDVVAVLVEQDDEIVVDTIRVTSGHGPAPAIVLTHDAKLPTTLNSAKSDVTTAPKLVANCFEGTIEVPYFPRHL
ncbi:hypothetical protein O6R08_09760 [Cutibacterium equinum]|uniref:Uncharacterized protein n=1 Tax=Cutibacterium equinum TaxID=3016342 RepID=A0ABY7R2J2_9ACTN|nr:hypothetical protein [Cutibacterium equinum]WCC81230.1 hypothetical protein O6R08_09760 [Cutibacterium equinum]